MHVIDRYTWKAVRAYIQQRGERAADLLNDRTAGRKTGAHGSLHTAPERGPVRSAPSDAFLFSKIKIGKRLKWGGGR